MPELEISPLRTIIIMSDSGLSLLQKSSDPKSKLNSQLVTGMFSALLTFFESEVDKGDVRIMAFSDSKMHFTRHLNLIIIVEFENFLDEEVAKEIFKEICLDLTEKITAQHLDPNKYTPLLREIDFTPFFSTKWHRVLLEERRYHNLFSGGGVALLQEEKLIVSLQGEAELDKTDIRDTITRFSCRTDDPIHIHELPEQNSVLAEFYTQDTLNTWILLLPLVRSNLIQTHEMQLLDYFTFLDRKRLSIIIPSMSELEFAYFIPTEEDTSHRFEPKELLRHSFMVFKDTIAHIVENIFLDIPILILTDRISYHAFIELMKVFHPGLSASVSPYLSQIGTKNQSYDIIVAAESDKEFSGTIIDMRKNLITSDHDPIYFSSIDFGAYQTLEEVILKLENDIRDVTNYSTEIFFLLNNLNSTLSFEEFTQLYESVDDKRKWKLAEMGIKKKFGYLNTQMEKLENWNSKLEPSFLSKFNVFDISRLAGKR